MEATRYWVEIILDPSENFEMVEIRAVASGLVYQGQWAQRRQLFSLMSKIGTDPTREATEMLALLRGHEVIIPLPEELLELLADNRPSIHRGRPSIASYPKGAKAAYLKLLEIEDKMDGEEYELVHLYLLQVAEAQASHNIEMSQKQTLQWIVNHWHLGDVGCAQALDPRQRRQATAGFDVSTRTPRRPSRSFEERHTVPHASAPTPTPPVREHSIPQPELQPRSPEPTKAARQAPTPLPLSAQTPPGTPAQPDSAPETIQTNMSIEEEPEVVQPNVSTTRHESAAMDDLRAAVAKLRGPLL